MGLDKLNLKTPIIDKLSEDKIESVIKEIKKVITFNHQINTKLCPIIQKSIGKETNGVRKYELVKEKYDDLGNAIVKLINIGVSSGIARASNKDNEINIDNIFEVIEDDVDVDIINTDQPTEYKGEDIISTSILSHQSNIKDTISLLTRDVEYDYIEYKDWFMIILSKMYCYGYGAGYDYVNDYRMGLITKCLDKENTTKEIRSQIRDLLQEQSL